MQNLLFILIMTLLLMSLKESVASNLFNDVFNFDLLIQQLKLLMINFQFLLINTFVLPPRVSLVRLFNLPL